MSLHVPLPFPRPQGWDVVPFFAATRERRRRNAELAEENLLSLSHGRIVRKDIKSADGLLPESFATYQIVEPGNVVFRFTDLQNDQRSLRTGLVTERGIITSAYLAVEPLGFEARYFAYLMRSYDLAKIFYRLGGGVRQGLNWDDVRRVDLLRPPLPTQGAIADYLDHETQQLDGLIRSQERFVALLTERRRALIDRATDEVTGDEIRLRFLYRPSAEANHPTEDVLSVYREYGIVPKSSRGDNHNLTPEDLTRYLLVRPGDLVVNRMKAWQGALGAAEHRGIVSGDYEVLRPVDARLEPRFAHYLLRSQRLIGEYRVRSSGIRPAQWRLYWEQMADITIHVPSRDEQVSIARRLDDETAKIDALVGKTLEHVTLARERRAALITAAVTGQIDETRKAG